MGLENIFGNAKITDIDETENEFCFDLECKNNDYERSTFLSGIPILIHNINWLHKSFKASISKDNLDDFQHRAIKSLQKELTSK
ncbi:hypothetical protein [Aquimarina muelleri]|uniref:Uncharacterized protein n=1 Tax=Aquimarina muelleri TaxID=279356 RepID=A0A918N545_9FLAO|nr:hypothetical protein [Aquimarina muelleri]MCX2764947.1 hypothetical protein [Aquimarina muelleri]GGX34684.1 hypothetical protein GCM10007384_39010 [Aquimarina muelleri]